MTIIDPISFISAKLDMLMHSALYLSIHAILMIFFAIRVILLRRKHQVSLGHGESHDLLTASRVFGNHNEYTPMFLLLLVVLDFIGTQAPVIHALGVAFTLSRLFHAYGLSTKMGVTLGRAIGMIVTFLCLLSEAVLLTWHFLTATPHGLA